MTVAEAVERIDVHLAAIPAGRNLVTTDEHIDVLLDVRNAALALTEAVRS